MTTPSLEQIIAKAINDDGWTCDIHEPHDFGDCTQCRDAQLHTAAHVVAVIRDSGLTVIATGGADETEPEHLFFAADVIERLHHDVEDADSQTVSAWRLRDRAHTIGCERRAAQVAERNNP